MKFGITSHTIVKNEERFVGFALQSVLPYVDKAFVWDTGSGDKTADIIQKIKSPKISFAEKGAVSRKGLADLRSLQLSRTDTPWFLLLDGDEIWPQKNLLKLISAMKNAKPETVALVNRTRNCIGDLYHYLGEEKGKYRIGPWSGHLNIRAIRKLGGLTVCGEYPLEAYTLDKTPIQNLVGRLEFTDTWYLHTSHLRRSNWVGQLKVFDRMKKYKFLKKEGIELNKNELPEVLR